MKRLLSLVCVALLAPSAAGAQAYRLDQHYEKTEVMVAMRDGVELFTQVYAPRDESEPHPVLLFRTPYGIGDYGESLQRGQLGPSAAYAPANYVFVYQDVRGKFRSQGTFEVMEPVHSKLDAVQGEVVTDETTDTWDTIEWIVRNVPNHNGRVGQWGVSYPGWQTVMGMIDAHPALVASSPQASPADMFLGDDFHHNGAFRLMYTFDWLSGNAATRSGASGDGQGVAFDYGTSDGYAFFLELGPLVNVDRRYFGGRVPTWNEYMQHGTYDAYWQRQDVLQHMRDIRPTVMHVAGWFDAEDFYGPLEIYRAIEANDAENRSTLVVGPWQHGGWSFGTGTGLGEVGFGQDTSVFYRDVIGRRFFEALLEQGEEPGLPEALVFETGANEWREYDRWPPEEVEQKSLYFHADGVLSFEPPSESEGDPGYDEFLSDPADPVPFSATPGVWQGHTWMIEDQRFAAAREDVLVYQTAPLEEDVVVAGPLLANLEFTTTGTDADWIVKLIDVFPPEEDDERGGFQMLLAGEVFRAKFKSSFEHPEPLVPGELTHLEFDLRDRNHRFLAGHRIMVQVQSSWFPVIDRNPQRFCDIYHAEADDFRAATHRVYRTPANPSRVEVGVLH